MAGEVLRMRYPKLICFTVHPGKDVFPHSAESDQSDPSAVIVSEDVLFFREFQGVNECFDSLSIIREQFESSALMVLCRSLVVRRIICGSEIILFAGI